MRSMHFKNVTTAQIKNTKYAIAINSPTMQHLQTRANSLIVRTARLRSGATQSPIIVISHGYCDLCTFSYVEHTDCDSGRCRSAGSRPAHLLSIRRLVLPGRPSLAAAL